MDIAEARAFHDHVPVIDLHADTPKLMHRMGYELAQRHERPMPRAINYLGHVDVPRMRDGGVAAQIFGLFPQKGSLEPGSDADVVIFDPTVNWTCSTESTWSKCDYNPYEGRKVRGKVEKTFVRGRLVYESNGGNKGEFKGQKGDGQYLRRPKFERVL